MDTSDELQKLLDDLGIDGDSVYQILLSDGTEILAEIVEDAKSKFVVVVNPLRSFKEPFVEDGALMNIEVLFPFDYNQKDPILELNSKLIITKYKVDEEKLERYASTLFEYYFPTIQVELDDPKCISNIKSNVISFLNYKEKRVKGLF